MRIRIIDGSDAGISAALAARDLNPNAGISVFLADDFPNFSICGLPFFVSGEAFEWQSLAHRIEFELYPSSGYLVSRGTGFWTPQVAGGAISRYAGGRAERYGLELHAAARQSMGSGADEHPGLDSRIHNEKYRLCKNKEC